jgi:glycosyltransferase involved in cell wall biosynthesis
MMVDGISIIIPSLNEEANIRECLSSLVQLDYPLFEVIIVDGMSTDKTREIIKEEVLPEFPNFRLLDNPDKYTAQARNIGIKAAKYNFIYFTDADCQVEPNTISLLKSYLDTMGKYVAGVGGANFSKSNAPSFVRAISLAQQTFIGNLGSVQGKVFNEVKEVPSISTCNALYRKSALIDVGLFSNKDLGEDWLLNYKLRKKYKLFVVPKSFVWHNLRSSPGSYFSNTYRYGLARMTIMKKYPKTISLKYLLPLVFLFSMFLFPYLLIPYIAYLVWLSRRLDKKLYMDITISFLLLHFGFAVGELLGLFTDKVRL